MEKILKAVKPFASKSHTRPVLMGALVIEKHVIATNGYILIRVKHAQEVEAPYLHSFDKKPVEGTYPDVSRIIPEPSNAREVLTLDVKEWLDVFKLGKIAAKSQDKEFEKILILNGNTVLVNFNLNAPTLDRMSFKHEFKTKSKDINVCFNCSYMITALQAAKNLKAKTLNLHFYGEHRPMLLSNDDIEIILLQIRTH